MPPFSLIFEDFMKLFTPTFPDYELLDSGNGKRLERFGNNVVLRPESTALWSLKEPRAGNKAAAICGIDAEGRFEWERKKNFDNEWRIGYEDKNMTVPVQLELRYSKSKNIGVFPEQASNWGWIASQVRKQYPRKCSVLNLFAYTGASTLVAAAAGAEVCHVDASQAAVTWARQNQALSKLHDAPIRWIVDDSLGFMRREINRGKQYDAIIMDPPAFGRDPKGKVFKFEEQIHDLLALAVQLSPDPQFFILNGYSLNLPATALANMLQDYYPKATIECGELAVTSKGGRVLPCGIVARFKMKE